MPLTFRRIQHFFGKHYWVPGIIFHDGWRPVRHPDSYYCYFCGTHTPKH